MIAPKLRFSEFKDEWNESNVGSLISNSSEKFNPLKETVNLPCVELEHLSQGTGEIIGYCSSVKQKSIKNKFNEKNVLFGKLRPYLKKYAKPNFKGVCSSEIWVLSSQRLNTNFLFQYIQTRAFLDLTLIQSGSKMPRAEWEMVADGTIFYPQEKEQTKIAEFLSAVDDKISQLSRQLELLNQYKKGVMQKIFSQEIRFKNDNGEDFGEWEEDSLGNLCSITTGKLDANAMVENGKYRFYTCAREYYYINDFAFDTDALLISGNGANVGYIHHYNGKFNAYQRTYVLDKWKQNIIYIKYFLEMFLKKRINDGKNEGNTPYIVLSVLSEMPIKLPSIQEQEKIAGFLTAIDEQIDHTTAQLTHTKQWKKGLLQQMFV